MSGNKANENKEKVGGPSMIFLPFISNFINQTKTRVSLTGIAAVGAIGPTIGLVDVAVSDDSYDFRVSLPGVSRDEKGFGCEIEMNGKILIKGVTTTGEKTVCTHYTQSGFQDAITELMPSRPLHHLFPVCGSCEQQRFEG